MAVALCRWLGKGYSPPARGVSNTGDVRAPFSAAKQSPSEDFPLCVRSALASRVCTGDSPWTLWSHQGPSLFFCSSSCQKLTFYLICGLSPRADVVPALICASAPPCSAQVEPWSHRASFPLAFVAQMNESRATRCPVCCSRSPRVDIYPFGLVIGCTSVI